MAVAMFFASLIITADYSCATNDRDELVVVSLGDSYSSGEGIPSFYGEEETVSRKINNCDWLAHRSEHSWPGTLVYPRIEKEVSAAAYRAIPNKLTTRNGEPAVSYNSGRWYFVASSGATTKDLLECQGKKVRLDDGGWYRAKTVLLPAQLDVFDEVKSNGQRTDYITVTIGGNDLGFSSIISTAALHPTYLTRYYHKTTLEKDLDDALNHFENEVGTSIKQSYKEICNRAGEKAHLIVAGYPQLIAPGGERDNVFDAFEADIINTKVSEFNSGLQDIVYELEDDINISFVSVEGKNNFDGHGAYAKDAYISGVHIYQDEDINGFSPISSYSFHPNKKGAEVYRKCVQREIDRIEGQSHSAIFNKNNMIGKKYDDIDRDFGPLQKISKEDEWGTGFECYKTRNGLEVGFLIADSYNPDENDYSLKPICSVMAGNANQLFGIKNSESISEEELMDEITAIYMSPNDESPFGEVRENVIGRIEFGGEMDYMQICRAEGERGTDITSNSRITIDYASYLICW